MGFSPIMIKLNCQIMHSFTITIVHIVIVIAFIVTMIDFRIIMGINNFIN